MALGVSPPKSPKMYAMFFEKSLFCLYVFSDTLSPLSQLLAATCGRRSVNSRRLVSYWKLLGGFPRKFCWKTVPEEGGLQA